MLSKKRRLLGLSLVEVLVAVTFLGICASSILTCVSTSSRRVKEIEQREIVYSFLVSQMEVLAHNARQPTVAEMNTSNNTTYQGIPLTLTRKVQKVSGRNDLYLVEATAAWKVTSTLKDRNDTLTFTTYVRSPYG